MASQLQIFFNQHPVFHLDEVCKCIEYSGKKSSLYTLIRYHLKQGHLKRIKNSLYAYVQPGSASYVDSYLLASKLAKDAVIGYQSALEYWGILHSMRNDFVYLTHENVSQPRFSFDGIRYQAVFFPKILVEKKEELFGVIPVDRLGQRILVTNLERTFVDILDRYYMINDWEEIHRCIEKIPYLKLDEVVQYALMLEKSTTIAKVGFFLDRFKDQWFVEDKHLDELKKYIPKIPLYINKGDEHLKASNQLVKEWNIRVPKSLLKKNWEEPYEDI